MGLNTPPKNRGVKTPKQGVETHFRSLNTPFFWSAETQLLGVETQQKLLNKCGACKSASKTVAFFKEQNRTHAQHQGNMQVDSLNLHVALVHAPSSCLMCCCVQHNTMTMLTLNRVIVLLC